MRTILVTGVSGSGKSTVSRRLAAAGHHAVSTDSAEGLCRWVDEGGNPVVRPLHPDLAWLTRHRWVWDRARLDQLVDSARHRGVEVLFLCGDAANAGEIVDRFDRIVLLRVDLATMLARLRDPRRGNDFGRAGQSRDYLVQNFVQWQRNLQRHADVEVDATASLDAVTRHVVRAAGAGE